MCIRDRDTRMGENLNIGKPLESMMKKLTSGKVRFAGVGGVHMLSEGLESLFPIEELSILGVFELVPKIPKLFKRIRETVHDILIKNPCAVITIDAKGFTFRVAKQIAIKQNKKIKKIKLIHIVAPTVWAYRPGRAKKTAKIFDHLLTLFPFETAYFIPHGLKTSFVGHPALEEKEGVAEKFKKSFSIPKDCLILSLLPGSRTSEVDRLLPIFEETIFISENILLSPNPANASSKLWVGGFDENVNITLFDITGRVYLYLIHI